MLVNDDDAEKSLCLKLLFKMAKKKSPEPPVSTLQSKTNQLTEKRDL